MVLPSKRNEVKRKRRGNSGHTVRQRAYFINKRAEESEYNPDMEYEHNQFIVMRPGAGLESLYGIDDDDIDDDDGIDDDDDIDDDGGINEREHAGEW